MCKNNLSSNLQVVFTSVLVHGINYSRGCLILGQKGNRGAVPDSSEVKDGKSYVVQD